MFHKQNTRKASYENCLSVKLARQKTHTVQVCYIDTHMHAWVHTQKDGFQHDLKICTIVKQTYIIETLSFWFYHIAAVSLAYVA